MGQNKLQCCALMVIQGHVTQRNSLAKYFLNNIRGRQHRGIKESECGFTDNIW